MAILQKISFCSKSLFILACTIATKVKLSLKKNSRFLTSKKKTNSKAKLEQIST